MKIGILTYHRAENYGALLQAYALFTYLRSRGHDVSFVDYWPKYHENYFKILSLKNLMRGSLLSKLLCLYNGTIWAIPRLRRKRVMQSFMNEQLGLLKQARYTTSDFCCSEYDVVVYGSDQIWRKQNLPGHKGFDYIYFASDNIVAKKISYAGSMGTINTTSEEDELLKQYYAKFSAISVRETPLRDYLYKLGFNTTVVLDPVFLLKPENWRSLYSSSQKKFPEHILFYNLLNNKQSRKIAEKLSAKTKLPIVEITKKYGIMQCGNRYNHDASVQEFLSLIDSASYIVSNSFHGVAFSIIFEKQFFATGMGARANRVLSLLKAFGIENRYIDDLKDIPNTIDYGTLKTGIEILRIKSEQYLINAIDNE